MTLERRIAAAFALDDDAWLRHANPWSVHLRNTVLPILVLALWSRIWIGWWSAIPISIAILWSWLNPRIFPPPASLDSWASKAVLGERVWLHRDRITIPEHHRRVPQALSALTAAGTLFVLWGVIVLDFMLLLFGMALVYCGKLWFLDRMVWLWEEMREAGAEFGERGRS